MPGIYELLFFGFIILLLFGTRLPMVMRSMGQSITEFKKGARDADSELKEETPGNRPV
ncbi:MAG TPA: twin-arginine translocase TatA/TatE family subunit [Planctomycetaceae bacterium]|jgi:sec-independent protein translocase protein TatA|nr:twin-arginine translocase TatA/TatE family subunit [Planctomycetaceae bacterium]